ncbi:MAG: Asp23/Gls24 family envelope stress response protein, partial [Clostridia bacterium]|nr:Asp23/Gls24 family envelope stress response protein [Clostridia bacterium]
IVDFGVRIPDVAFKIQENVKKAVETMTGLKAIEINVHVQGVAFPNTEIREEETRVK